MTSSVFLSNVTNIIKIAAVVAEKKRFIRSQMLYRWELPSWRLLFKFRSFKSIIRPSRKHSISREGANGYTQRENICSTLLNFIGIVLIGAVPIFRVLVVGEGKVDAKAFLGVVGR